MKLANWNAKLIEREKEYEKLRQERRSVQDYVLEKEQLRLISQGELREVLAEKDNLKQSLQGEVMYKEEYERMKEELSAAMKGIQESNLHVGEGK